MPYTKKELESNEYYQNLKDEEEQKYLQQRELLRTAAATNPGSGGIPADGRLLVRDSAGTILLFESPYNGELFNDETTVIPKTLEVRQYRINDPILDEVIDREITEL
tara:strand:- start:354 stop:674 length:321 start_codon:yes stop_codon:yes gene_type:complete